MNAAIQLPRGALRYVLYQRTGYLALPRTYVYRGIAKFWPRELIGAAVAIESKLRRKRIVQLFCEDFAREYASIKESLPGPCDSILDIGCGVGGIDVLLSRHYVDAPPKFFLLDKTQVDRVFYGFKKRGAFYNSLEVARDVLIANGVSPGRLQLMQATEDNRIPMDGPVDLVISLISWGFHYPVETYVDRVYELLRPGGHLILDVRNKTDGEKALLQRFETVRPIEVTEKYTRTLAVK